MRLQIFDAFFLKAEDYFGEFFESYAVLNGYFLDYGFRIAMWSGPDTHQTKKSKQADNGKNQRSFGHKGVSFKFQGVYQNGDELSEISDIKTINRPKGRRK